MTKPNDGGPAFPIAEFYMPNGNLAQVGDPGMSRRDWLAGRALVGVIIERTANDVGWTPTAIAQSAYDIADAMIAEGDKD